MKLHRAEEIWLVVGVGIIILAMVFTGYQAFAHGMAPPSGMETLDPQKVDETAPFDNPGIFEIGENAYEVVMTLEAFRFNPNEIEIPAGSEVHFTMTSKDVVHGIQVIGTNINAMVTPGHVQRISQTFDTPGEYLVICNEYCGVGHQMMAMTIIVK
ncbi:cytochrome c oxidase subunit II [Oceanobacillus sp. FSL K6-2867]|uniref:cytochrome c oxidase subunit II n=1 Tax=Oceanobacillus sp. FSL K6-2867 TaxID=2954748 RepID=UPI0030DAEA29